jgi:acetyltransferase
MASMVHYGYLLGLEKREVRRMAADRETASRIIERRLGDKERYYMPEREANQVLQCYGFPVINNILVKDVSDLDAAIDEIGFPAVLKISSSDIVHKFDAGGVRLNIESREEAVEAFEEIIANARAFNPSAEIDGVIMARMVRSGVEVILGAVRDPKFGPICMFGLGGTFVEAIKDVTFRVAPMWEISADIMIHSIKAYNVLKGIRGLPPSDIAAIKDCMLRLSQMVSDHPEIAELDINPLIVYAEGMGCVVADSRILLTRGE